MDSVKPLCKVAVLSMEDIPSPTILNIGIKDITFKNNTYLHPDIKYPLALTLNFQYEQLADSFDILVNNENYSIKNSDIKNENYTYKLIINKYITKLNTKYNISISAIKN